MHRCYIDDSGDEDIRIYSVLAIPATEWKSALEAIKTFRRALKAKEVIFVTVEFHATDFVAGRGRIAPKPVFKGTRCRIFKETLSFVAELPGASLFNAVAASKANEARVFERMMIRINITMKSWSSQTILISDEGKDYTSLIRRMGVYNPIPGRFGAWPEGGTTRNIPLDRIIEDPVFRDSATSQFIQLADFCAYALFRSEKPLPARTRYGLDSAFLLLENICTPQCFSADPRKLGIIRDT